MGNPTMRKNGKALKKKQSGEGVPLNGGGSDIPEACTRSGWRTLPLLLQVESNGRLFMGTSNLVIKRKNLTG
jgi:hypothetical protein